MNEDLPKQVQPFQPILDLGWLPEVDIVGKRTREQRRLVRRFNRFAKQKRWKNSPETLASINEAFKSDPYRDWNFDDPEYATKSWKEGYEGGLADKKIYNIPAYYQKQDNSKPYINKFKYDNPAYINWEKQTEKLLKDLYDAGYVKAVDHLYATLQNYGPDGYKYAYDVITDNIANNYKTPKQAGNDAVKYVSENRDKTVPYIFGVTYGPMMAGAAGSVLGTVASDVIGVGAPFWKELGKQTLAEILGRTALNKGYEALTGETFDLRMSDLLQNWGVSLETADIISPFFNLGGYMSYKLLNTTAPFNFGWFKNLNHTSKYAPDNLKNMLKFRDNTLLHLIKDGTITPEEAQYLKTISINYGNKAMSEPGKIILDYGYNLLDGGFSLFHELGHQLGNKRGSEFLEQFHAKLGRGYLYSFKLPEGIDKLARNQDELFADWLGFKIGGNKSLNFDGLTPELVGRRNHFRSLKLSNQEKQGIPKSERIVINRHNAPKVTDLLWDIVYEEAVNRNDINKVLWLRDLHFITKAPDTKFITSEGLPQHNYHGGQKGIKVFLNAKDNPNYKNTRHQGYGHPESRLGIYFSDNKNIANNYKYNKDGEIYDVYLNAKNPLTLKYSTTLINRLKNMFLLNKSFTPDIIRINDLNGILKNNDAVRHIGVENVIWDNTKIKLANPITYDNMGNFIPLSKRDNFNNFDIRYKKGGKLIPRKNE